MPNDPTVPQVTGKDPWHGIRVGDRFYIADWNAREGTELWEEVTDLWWDPVRGQNSPKRGYMVATRLMGRGSKRALAASTLRGRRYVNVAAAEAAALDTMERVAEVLNGKR